MQRWLLTAEPREEADRVVDDDGIDVSVGELLPSNCIVAGVRDDLETGVVGTLRPARERRGSIGKTFLTSDLSRY